MRYINQIESVITGEGQRIVLYFMIISQLISLKGLHGENAHFVRLHRSWVNADPGPCASFIAQTVLTLKLLTLSERSMETTPP